MKKPNASWKVKAAISFAVSLGLLCFAGAVSGAGAGNNAGQQKLFATPEEAVKSLTDAAKAGDRTALASIFGPEYDKLLSGDDVQDKEELQHFAANLDKS